MIRFYNDRVWLCRSIVVLRRRAGEVSEWQIRLSIAEPVIQERYLLSVQGSRSTQEIQHLRADILVSRISAKCEDSQGGRLERRIHASLRKRLHLRQAFGKRSERESFTF